MAKETTRPMFADLHRRGDPLVLFNIWDPGTALTVAAAGAPALATGSWSVAESQGYRDGQQIPLQQVIDNARRIVELVSIPLSLDFEGAYAVNPDEVAGHVSMIIDTGIAGMNFEDQIIGGQGCYDMSTQAKRIAAVADKVATRGQAFFINARTDLFLKTAASEHAKRLEDAIARSRAYAEAGADGFFAPGLNDASLIQELCEQCPLPVNILRLPEGLSIQQLAACQVARVSHGPWPYRDAMSALKQQAAALYA